MNNTLFRRFLSIIVCISMVLSHAAVAKASAGISFSESFSSNGSQYNYKNEVTIDGQTYTYESSGSWDEDSGSKKKGSGGSSKRERASIENLYQYAKASNIQEIIDICKKYSDRDTVTGVRNQIAWMNQLYIAAVQDFAASLGLGETLLLALLNHSDINTAIMGSSYSTGDINREVAKKIVDGAAGYVDINTIAKATGLKAKDVQSILKRIASGSITEKTIAVGKNRTRASAHGVYVNNQALKQDKVWKYLVAEVERMTNDPESLTVLYNSLGSGYVDNMLSGQDLDKYKVSLYKNHLAKTLDTVLENDNPISISTITKNDPYKVTEKAHSALSILYKYEMDIANNTLDESVSEELVSFLKKSQSGGLTESEAIEYLVLSGQYTQGEYGIEEAAKLLSNSYKHLKEFEVAMDTAGDVFNAIEKAQKAQEFIDYMIYDHSEHIILLDTMEKTLADSGEDLELMAAAKDLKQDYETKYSAELENIYGVIIDEGIDSAKSAFPPLGIAEACISLGGMITGGSDKASALETGFAMQGICKQALEDYENAVVAVNKGDTSEEAVSNVLTTFEIARQSLISYYEAMITLSETEEQKNTYSAELKKLEKVKFGYATVSLP